MGKDKKKDKYEKELAKLHETDEEKRARRLAKKAKKEGASEGKSLQNQTHRGCHAHTRKQHQHVRTNVANMAYRTGPMSPFVFPPSLAACRLPQPAQLRPLPRHS